MVCGLWTSGTRCPNVDAMSAFDVSGVSHPKIVASQDKKSLDVGANLFVGNLDTDLDEKLLYDTFSAFGRFAGSFLLALLSCSGFHRQKEFGRWSGFFVGNLYPDVDEKLLYDTFSAFGVIVANPKAMNGQYLCNQQITVSYAYKKDTNGERHSTPAVMYNFLL
ncbi:Splicing factor 3b subunit [Thalictrum thalictroides]|uniref:Splicing factor 3b subunit n=1 Tax=Thalictrum thalictroides TaxID=46969 RepID=A0A7J6V3I4_THATH|nr:Splicing factor 3b subunit [Thalictrum thalictroides]